MHGWRCSSFSATTVHKKTEEKYYSTHLKSDWRVLRNLEVKTMGKKGRRKVKKKPKSKKDKK